MSESSTSAMLSEARLQPRPLDAVLAADPGRGSLYIGECTYDEQYIPGLFLAALLWMVRGVRGWYRSTISSFHHLFWDKHTSDLKEMAKHTSDLKEFAVILGFVLGFLFCFSALSAA